MVLGGELDTWTPPVDVARGLTTLGGNSRLVELANSTHVVGQGDTICGTQLIRAFVARPEQLAALDASCAASVAPIHSVGVFPQSTAGETPLVATPGSGASATALRLAAAAVQTAGDAVARWQAIEAARDRGLHGGTVSASKGGTVLTLRGDQLIAGLPVSGTVTLLPAPLAEDGQIAVATLSLPARSGGPASLTATWTTAGAGAVARVGGQVAGSSVSGTMPAP
jgi:hypothetical protein